MGLLYLVKYRIYGLDKAAYQMRHAWKPPNIEKNQFLDLRCFVKSRQYCTSI